MDKECAKIIAENCSPSFKKVLLMGYNGANNTGSETRLISIIEDLRMVLGKDVELTIPTLNEKNLRRYIEEDEHLKIVPIPSIYFFALKNIVKRQDLVLLVEGSCYMDTWTSALLWAFLWTTRCAYNQGIPCIAYAVDSGELSTFNRFLVKREASKTDLIITRTKYAGDRLIDIGVSAPIVNTADCAFSFETKMEDKNILKKIWNSEAPDSQEGFVGIAVVDFHLWPVVIRPWGKKVNLYKWPYYFSRSRSRVQKSEILSKYWANEADRIVEKHGKNIVIICMEELDEPLAIEVKNKMRHPEKAQIVSAGTYNASQMTEVLRSLELLITSRYHAGVLSMKNSVPQIGIGHDQRLKGLYKDMKIEKELLIDYPKGNSNLEGIWENLSKKVDHLIENPKHVRELIGRCYKEQLELSQNNKKFLKKFLFEKEDVMV
ncbi:MAG: polysaccharide pyruvyl transferase family protein [Methanobacterium sp.]|nr:polysaccharide pyruvyl transferase family protein [Methanobacterium sp.]